MSDEHLGISAAMQDQADRIDALLACPCCASGLTREAAGHLVCHQAGCSHRQAPFERIANVDVLVNYAASHLDRETLVGSLASSTLARRPWQRALRFLVDGRTPVTPRFARRMIEDLLTTATPGERPVLLVIGGGEIGAGCEALYDSDTIRLVGLDIYASPHVDLVADAHCLPLRDASIDGVWIQSVLEHVVDPARVVSEIHRVLKPDGRLFTDTSFLWPVCEGAYDFTRFTASGQRWLLRNFTIEAAGSSSGPGTVAVLAIRYLLQSLLRSTKLGQIAALPFVWLRLLDRFCDTRRGIDAAGGTYFYARKAGQPIAVDELIAFYDWQTTEGRGDLASAQSQGMTKA